MLEREFTSCMSKGQRAAVFIWLPVHMLVLPFLVSIPLMMGLIDETAANVLVYAIGAAFMLLTLWKFFRQDFDALCDRPFLVLITVIGGYWLSWIGEILVSLLLQALELTGTGGNNEDIIALAKANIWPTTAMSVFLAPIVEECLFRGGIFGVIRQKSRFWAYAVSALAFGLYHVWSYALSDPTQLLFALQYIPSALAMALVYERTNSIWSSIFLHILSNGVAMLTIYGS